jgi:hypothetical protein
VSDVEEKVPEWKRPSSPESALALIRSMRTADRFGEIVPREWTGAIETGLREKDARIKELEAEVNCIHCGEPKQCWCGLHP